MNNKPYTQNEYVNKVKSINPTIEILGEYTTTHARILVRCKKCQNEWTPKAYLLLQGIGCPECGKLLAVKNRKGKTAKKTTDQFKQELYSVNKNIIILGEYKGSKSKIDCSCIVCGFKWSTNPYTLLKGAGCPNCYKTDVSKHRRYSPESFAEKLSLVNPNIQLLSDFTKATETIKAKCKKCENIWFPKAHSLLQGRGCPKCAHIVGARNNTGKTGLKSFDTFTKELAQIDNSIAVIGEYTNTHTNIKCRCNRCNHIWYAKPYSLLQGHGCPRCAKSGTSFMEQLILLSFRDVLGDEAVLSRDRSYIKMELDILIPSYNLAIEPGNWTLHQKSIKRDNEKRQRCFDKR